MEFIVPWRSDASGREAESHTAWTPFSLTSKLIYETSRVGISIYGSVKRGRISIRSRRSGGMLTPPLLKAGYTSIGTGSIPPGFLEPSFPVAPSLLLPIALLLRDDSVEPAALAPAKVDGSFFAPRHLLRDEHVFDRTAWGFEHGVAEDGFHLGAEGAGAGSHGQGVGRDDM